MSSGSMMLRQRSTAMPPARRPDLYTDQARQDVVHHHAGFSACVPDVIPAWMYSSWSPDGRSCGTGKPSIDSSVWQSRHGLYHPVQFIGSNHWAALMHMPAQCLPSRQDTSWTVRQMLRAGGYRHRPICKASLQSRSDAQEDEGTPPPAGFQAASMSRAMSRRLSVSRGPELTARMTYTAGLSKITETASARPSGNPSSTLH